jgi:hypothetical protein
MKYLLLPLLLAACASHEAIIKPIEVKVPFNVCLKPTLEAPPKELTAAFDLTKPCQDTECAERVKAGLADREVWRRDALACRAQVDAMKVPTVQ